MLSYGEYFFLLKIKKVNYFEYLVLNFLFNKYQDPSFYNRCLEYISDQNRHTLLLPSGVPMTGEEIMFY